MQKLIMLCVAMMLFSSCAVFNPYNENFTCAKSENGKCGTIDEAYVTSLKASDTRQQDNKKNDNPAPMSTGPETSYKDAVYKRLAGLIKEPVAPVVVPPEVLRVLLLSYTSDKNDLFMPRFVYTLVGNPKWIVTEPFGLSKETE